MWQRLEDVAEISQPTAKDWIMLLEGLGIIYLLRPYANNHLKRLAKTPKLYFCDTGLCAYLSMWPSKETLMNGAASGHYFENFVVMELLRNYSYGNGKFHLTYYRDANAKEIDVFVEINHQISPLEIKKSANPDRREVKKFGVIEKGGGPQGCGEIVCMCENVVPISNRDAFIPCVLI